MKKIFTLLTFAATAAAMNAQIVINEVYGGGGGATAVYKNDFVELVNLGTAAQTLTGASLQYASAAGNFNSYVLLPDITLQPGQKYLIEMVPSTAATAGADLPTADFQVKNNTSFTNGNTYNGGFNMAAGAGKIALAKDATQITTPTGANVLDFVGYGTTASLFEGAGAAPAPDATTSVSRNGADTNNNAADFTKGTPTPQNSSTLGTVEVNGKKISLVKNTVTDSALLFGAKADVKIYSVTGQLVKTASVNDGTSLDVSSLAKGVYIVAGEVEGQKVSQKIIKK